MYVCSVFSLMLFYCHYFCLFFSFLLTHSLTHSMNQSIHRSTIQQMAVCAFIIIAGLTLFEPSNMVPFAPMGVTGIIRGSSAAFFGYLGYDEVRSQAGCGGARHLHGTACVCLIVGGPRGEGGGGAACMQRLWRMTKIVRATPPFCNCILWQ